MRIEKYIDYYNDKTTILRYTALSLAFLLVIILGFGARFFIEHDWNTADFWGDFGLSASLCVYCIFLSIPEAKDNYRKKVGGRYQECKLQFKEARDKVKDKDAAFDQWLDKFYREQRDDYYRQLLSIKGIRKSKVLELDLYELGDLKKPHRKVWDDGTETNFPSMTDEQIGLVRDILKGRISVRKIPNDAFKTMNGKIMANEYVTRSKSESKEYAEYAILIAGRLGLMCFISFIFAIFGLKLAQSQSAEQVINQIIDTISRIWTMVSSYVYGFSIGRTMVSNECDRIEFKTRVNTQFLSDKDFKPVDEEELLRRQIEEEEAKEIHPEIVEEGEGKQGENTPSSTSLVSV